MLNKMIKVATRYHNNQHKSPEQQKERRHNIYGFSLLEMLIVLAIMSILATISYASWQTYVLKVRRTEATSTLMNIAMAQEQHFYQHNRYSADLSVLLGINIAKSTSQNGYYKFTIVQQTQQEHGEDNFIVKATAIASQVKDKSCQIFTVNQLSERIAYDHQNSKSASCWD